MEGRGTLVYFVQYAREEFPPSPPPEVSSMPDTFPTLRTRTWGSKSKRPLVRRWPPHSFTTFIWHRFMFWLTGICGGTFHLTRPRILSIRSPNYPSNYEAGTDCEWTVVGPAGHTLSFSFTDVSMPWSSNCSTVDHLSFVEPTLDTEGRTTIRGKYSCEDLFFKFMWLP